MKNSPLASPFKPARSRRFRPAAGLLCLPVVSFLLAACAGDPGRMSGRVVEGPVSVVAVGETKDERLKAAGSPGVHLEIRSVTATGSRSMAGGVSGSDGAFSLALGAGQALSDQLNLTAKREGYVSTQGVTFVPGAGRELLI